MSVFQGNLINNFPVFIDSVAQAVEEVDSYHVGVTTTDAYVGNPAGCRELGALVTSTAGFDSSAAMCGPYAAGDTFITEADDLSDAFACAAQVGSSGDPIERPMDAMQAAVSTDLNTPGACNDGFLRDDALLVVLIITDEWDGPDDPEGDGSSGTAADWYDAVVAAKGGQPENAATIVLTNYEDGPCPPEQVFFDGGIMIEFADLFGSNGFTAGICEADYGPSFESAALTIEGACEGFIAPR